MGSDVVGERLGRGALGAAVAGAVVCNYREWRVSNLALQKILYIAEVVHLLKFGDADSPLIGEDFYAWPLGPVLPGLYERVKASGSSIIRPSRYFNGDMIPEKFPADQWRRCVFLERLAEALKYRFTPSLVSQTHVANGAWAHARAGAWLWELRGLHRTIGKDAILGYESRKDAFYADLLGRSLWPSD